MEENITKEKYTPTKKERDYILTALTELKEDDLLIQQSWDILNGRTLKQFWEDSNYDYNVIVSDDNDSNPVVPYSSSISRDKANTFISNLTLQLLHPSVVAQNINQEVDFVVSKVGRSILEWQFDNDGRPAESGQLKSSRGIHKMVVEGTQHIQDDVIKGRLNSQNVPNEEIRIPNFFQPNIQLQGHLMRIQEWIPYTEAKAEFEHLDNWKWVKAGELSDFINDDETFKGKSQGIQKEKTVNIMRRWLPVSAKDLIKLKKEGKIKSHIKKAKYFNIIINGVLMFGVDNLMPYDDGNYPINKGVFELFSPSDFYWGNSMPNKASQDKKWLDGWKTLIRYKAKLSAVPPILNFTGQRIDDDITVPGVMSDMPAGANKDQIVAVPGISNGITNGDIFVLKDATDDIERATSSPQTSGQQSQGKQTARETMIVEANAQKAMRGFAQQVAFLIEARTLSILIRSFQMLPRQDIQKIAIPGQIFDEGKSGVLEVIFEDISKLKSEEEQSFDVMEEEEAITGQVIRKVKINKEYIKNLDFYVKAVADSLPIETSAIREARARLKFETYAQRPDLFNIKSSARNLVREMGDDETEIINEQAQPQQVQQPQQGKNPLVKAQEKQTQELTI